MLANLAFSSLLSTLLIRHFPQLGAYFPSHFINFHKYLTLRSVRKLDFTVQLSRIMSFARASFVRGAFRAAQAARPSAARPQLWRQIARRGYASGHGHETAKAGSDLPWFVPHKFQWLVMFSILRLDLEN
jgi:hypothetical protein